MGSEWSSFQSDQVCLTLARRWVDHGVGSTCNLWIRVVVL